MDMLACPETAMLDLCAMAASALSGGLTTGCQVEDVWCLM